MNSQAPSIAPKMQLAVRLLLAIALIAALPCAFGQSADTSNSASAGPAQRVPGVDQIQHVVFIVKENRSYDNMFGKFPGGNGATQGPISTGQILQLSDAPDAYAHDICHGWGCFILAVDNGKMDGFDLQTVGSPCNMNGDYECYSQQDQNTMPNYWQYAQQFALGDNYFTSIKTATTPQHLYTVGAQSAGIITNAPAGCDSASNILLAKIDPAGNFTTQYPCVDIPTLMDELQNAGVSWRYYVDTKIPFNSMQLISHLRFGPLWVNNVTDRQFVTDVQNGALPKVSWLMATAEATDHPPYSLCFGENYTVNAINAIMNSKYWTTEPTAIVLVWDDPGGFYDHVSPQQVDQFGLGIRSPLLVISPYTPQGTISSVQYEHSSVLKFIENWLSLPSLTNRDANAKDMAADPALFNFNQSLRGPLTLTPRQCSPASTTDYNPTSTSGGTLKFYQAQSVGTPSPASTVTMRNFSMTTRLTFTGFNIAGDTSFTQTNTCGAGVAPLVNESPANCVISVVFNPTTAGVHTATMTVVDNDPTSPQVVTLMGTGTNLTLNPTLLNFGIQNVFMSGASQTAQLKNTGTSTISLNSITPNGDYSESDTCGGSLAPLGTCNITVVFTPTAAGTRFGTVTVNSNDGASPHILALTGVGTQVSLSPLNLTFGNQALGTSSASQPVTLTNNSNSTLTLANPNPGMPAIMVTGNNGEQPDTATPNFTQTNNCGNSLSPGGSCTINVTFSPVVQGALLGNLMVFDNQADSPQTINLSGTATASTNNPVPLISLPLSPGAKTPGSASFTLTVNGAGFVSSSKVNWNGVALATTFVNKNKLTATVPAANVANATTGTITVSNPTPVGGVSNSAFFAVSTVTTPTFAKTDLNTGTSPKGVVTGDFNGDGNLDFVVLNSASNTATPFINNGNGTFNALAAVSAGVAPFFAATGDFNHDGKLDLVVADNTGNTLTTLLGNGSGSFTTGEVTSTVWPTCAAAADVNLDGTLDLLAPNSVIPAISLKLGNSDGTYTDATLPPVVGLGPTGLAIADFNADNKLDVAVADSTDNNVSILKGKGDGTFTAGTKTNTAPKPVAVVAADFTGDGKVDLATINQTNSNASILTGSGTGTFTLLNSFNTGSVPSGIALGDFNADGKLDIATSNSSGNNVSLLLGNGDGTFQAHQDTNVGTAPSGIAVGDFNKDGKLDMVVTNQTSNTVSVLLQNGTTGGPQISFNPTSLTFPTQVLKTQSLPKNVVVTNTGTANLIITDVHAIGTDFKATTADCIATIIPNGSCTISVTFRPTNTGQRTGNVSVTDNAPGSPQTVPLTGVGTAVAFSPSSFNFGTVNVGNMSNPKAITMKNVATTGNLNITSISITGANPGDFSQTNNCPATLTPGQTCTINAVFKPTLLGARSANISVNDTGGGSPQTVPLSGTGN